MRGVTQRLAESVSRLCAVMSIRHVAGYFDLNWKTVKEIDKRLLERRLGPVDLAGVAVIGMVKVIKRMAYGFRDDNYFFLNIRAAFPGIG